MPLEVIYLYWTNLNCLSMIELAKLIEKKNEVINNLQRKITQLEKLDLSEKREVTINLNCLPEFLPSNPEKRGIKSILHDIFGDVMSEDRGAVYVFHLPENIERNKILDALKECSLLRNTSSISNVKNRNYDVLYVGSYKSHFCNRFYQHLGYASRGTGSLQLIHWAKPLFPEIKLTYFPIEFSPLALHNLIEIAMFKAVTPMIGRIERDILNE